MKAFAQRFELENVSEFTQSKDGWSESAKYHLIHWWETLPYNSYEKKKEEAHMCPPLRAFDLHSLAQHLYKSLSPGKPPWLFKQPKQSQRGTNTRPCSAYHFSQPKLLINYRTLQGHRGIILQDELSAIRNKEKDWDSWIRGFVIRNAVSLKIINNVDFIPSLNKCAYSKNHKSSQVQ